MTTGGESWLSESVQSAWLSCNELDIIAIHAYGTADFDTSSLKSYVQKAQVIDADTLEDQQNADAAMLGRRKDAYYGGMVCEIAGCMSGWAYKTRDRGACYFDTSNNECAQGGKLDTDTRNKNIKTWADQIYAAGLSQLYWQVLPNDDPHVSPLPHRTLSLRF